MPSKHSFCRNMLAGVMPDVRDAVPSTAIQKAWGWRSTTVPGHGEFQGPDGFYWHGQCCCVWHAKAEGWAAYLEHIGYLRPVQGELPMDEACE
jgi:hypothetical protein